MPSTSPSARVRLGVPQAHRLHADFCANTLVDPHWGEQIRFRRGNVLQVAMVFQGLTRGEAVAAWQPFFAAIDASPKEFDLEFSPLRIVSTDARTFWAPTFFKRTFGFIRQDDRPGVPASNVFWPGDQAQAAQVLHGYESLWLPAALRVQAARRARRRRLRGVAALACVAPSEQGARRRSAGRSPRTRHGNEPVMLDAFARVIMGAGGAPAYPGVLEHAPDEALARAQAAAIDRAAAALRKVAPEGGAYVSESNNFQRDWEQAFWGRNAARLRAVKAAIDPGGLFVTHHGPGGAA